MLTRSLLACMVCCLALSAGCAAQNPVLSAPYHTVSGPVTTVAATGFSSNPDNTQWRLACPEGTWMFGVDIAGDPTISALGPIYCITAGQGPKAAKIGTMAGNLPVPAIMWREYGSSTGYSSISLRKAEETDTIDAISFVYGPGMGTNRSLSAGSRGQAYGGIGDGATKHVACPPGQIITELYGETNGFNILTVGVRCRQSSGSAAGMAPSMAAPSLASKPAGAGRKLK